MRAVGNVSRKKQIPIPSTLDSPSGNVLPSQSAGFDLEVMRAIRAYAAQVSWIHQGCGAL
jgi:hypothetical protein